MGLLDLLFPRRCIGCGQVGSYFCLRCQKQLVLLPQRCPECGRSAIDGATHPHCRHAYGLDGLMTVFQNRGTLAKAIKLLKYRLVTDAAATLVNLIPQQVLTDLLFNKSWVLYPLPLHPERLRWRGFNQAEVMGKLLAKRLDIKVVNDLLVRQAKRTPQAEIKHRADRIANAKGLFKLNVKVLPNQIILFDDAWTTGATMKEAAKVLKLREPGAILLRKRRSD